MISKPMIDLKEKRYLVINVMCVFRANFNDTFYIEDLKFDLDELCKEELVWIDPYLGKSIINKTTIAITHCMDEELRILVNEDGVIKEHIIDRMFECILCEDYDNSKMLSSHISLRS